MKLTATIAAALAALLLPGCYTAEVDPTLVGIFVCQQDDDCPAGLACVNAACEEDDDLPAIEILGPEDEEVLVTDAPDVPIGPAPPPLPLTIVLQGELDLVAANSGTAHEFGQGYVVIDIDGEEAAIIDSGDIDNPTTVSVTVDNRAGPHRITAQAVRNDGIPYDNAEARGTRLFWIESALVEGVRPFVAVKSPWPGSTLPLDDAEVEIEVATLNFRMVPTGSGEVDGQGHSHIYYDKDFPECLMDVACDAQYITIVDDPRSVEAELPDSSGGSADLTAVLRHVGHDQYRFPFGCDPMENVACQPVFDTITIDRADP